MYCSRSCCARRLRTSRCRRTCASWRWPRSHRPPIRTHPSPGLASTFPGLPPISPDLPPTSPGRGSSIATPSWIRRKCRPRQRLYCPPKGQSTNCRRKRRRRTAHQIGPSENPARSLTAAHHSRSVGYSRRPSRRSGAVAVTEPFQPGSKLRAATRLRRRGAACAPSGRDDQKQPLPVQDRCLKPLNQPSGRSTAAHTE